MSEVAQVVAITVTLGCFSIALAINIAAHSICKAIAKAEGK